MKAPKAKESSNGQVCAPCVEPPKHNQINNQTEWTEREKELAEKYKVEPKLVSLLGEVTADSITEILDKFLRPLKMLHDAAEYDQEQRPVMDELTESQQQPIEEDKLATTGIEALDEHIDCLAYDAKTAAYVITQLTFTDNELGDRISQRLWSQIGKFTSYEALDQELIRKGEPETAADINWWLSFWQGVKHGEKIS